MTNYWLGVIGTWTLADAISSLYTYTGKNKKAKGQSFWRDHLLRILRGLLGIILIWIGAL